MYLLGFVFAVGALAISVVAFPLLLDKPATAATAVAFRSSINLILWDGGLGRDCCGALAAGAIVFDRPAAVLPILGHATWHLYRKG
jgi:uncharacterized membrane protein